MKWFNEINNWLNLLIGEGAGSLNKLNFIPAHSLRMDELIEMKLLKSIRPASGRKELKLLMELMESIIYFFFERGRWSEIKLFWFHGAAQLMKEDWFGLVFGELRGYGRHQPHCSAKRRQTQTNKPINWINQKRGNEQTNSFLSGCLSFIKFINLMEEKTKRKGVVFVNGAPSSPAARQANNKSNKLLFMKANLWISWRRVYLFLFNFIRH